MPRTNSSLSRTANVAGRWRQARTKVREAKADLVKAIMYEVDTRGVSVAQIARDLELDRTLVHTWIREAREAAK